MVATVLAPLRCRGVPHEVHTSLLLCTDYHGTIHEQPFSSCLKSLACRLSLLKLAICASSIFFAAANNVARPSISLCSPVSQRVFFLEHPFVNRSPTERVLSFPLAHYFHPSRGINAPRYPTFGGVARIVCPDSCVLTVLRFSLSCPFRVHIFSKAV